MFQKIFNEVVFKTINLKMVTGKILLALNLIEYDCENLDEFLIQYKGLGQNVMTKRLDLKEEKDKERKSKG